jgi:hypothetical protein
MHENCKYRLCLMRYLASMEADRMLVKQRLARGWRPDFVSCPKPLPTSSSALALAVRSSGDAAEASPDRLDTHVLTATYSLRDRRRLPASAFLQ